jgi:hypothetical protein
MIIPTMEYVLMLVSFRLIKTVIWYLNKTISENNLFVVNEYQLKSMNRPVIITRTFTLFFA